MLCVRRIAIHRYDIARLEFGTIPTLFFILKTNVKKLIQFGNSLEITAVLKYGVIYNVIIYLRPFQIFGIIIDYLLGSDKNLLSSLSLVWSVLSSKARTFLWGDERTHNLCLHDANKRPTISTETFLHRCPSDDHAENRHVKLESARDVRAACLLFVHISDG